jgi:hypothetical protein
MLKLAVAAGPNAASHTSPQERLAWQRRVPAVNWAAGVGFRADIGSLKTGRRSLAAQIRAPIPDRALRCSEPLKNLTVDRSKLVGCT